MRSVVLVNSGLTTSKLGFGTSRLHYLVSNERRRLLELAADFGITHFDTAPAYGDGLAEAELGHFVRGRRDRIVLATKYGFEPDPLLEAMSSLALALRSAPALARRIGLWTRPPPPLTANGLAESLKRSLRRLKTDYIDILFLHEPSIGRLTSPHAMLEALNKFREQGIIRAFGLSGNWADVGNLLREAPKLGLVLQTAEVEWRAECPPDITYGALSGGRQQYWSKRLPSTLIHERLRRALARRPQGVVLASTTNRRHLRLLVSALEGQSI
jgi:D-threo-aldose 1-dehydrogenase